MTRFIKEVDLRPIGDWQNILNGRIAGFDPTELEKRKLWFVKRIGKKVYTTFTLWSNSDSKHEYIFKPEDEYWIGHCLGIENGKDYPEVARRFFDTKKQRDSFEKQVFSILGRTDSLWIQGLMSNKRNTEGSELDRWKEKVLKAHKQIPYNYSDRQDQFFKDDLDLKLQIEGRLYKLGKEDGKKDNRATLDPWWKEEFPFERGHRYAFENRNIFLKFLYKLEERYNKDFTKIVDYIPFYGIYWLRDKYRSEMDWNILTIYHFIILLIVILISV